MTSTQQPAAPSPEEPTIGRLVADTTKDLSELVRGEIQLAKAELTFSIRAGGIGAALLAAAAFVIVLGIVMASFALAYFFVWLGLGTAVSFVIVFGIYVVIAAILGLIGVRKLKQVKAPEKTIESVKETKTAFKKS